MKCLSCSKEINGLNIFGVNHCWDCYNDPVKTNPDVIVCDCNGWCTKCEGERYYISVECDICEGSGEVEMWEEDDDLEWFEDQNEVMPCKECDNGYLYEPWYGNDITIPKEDLKEYWT